MRKLIVQIFILASMLVSANTFSQRAIDIEGRYSVGKTYCTVQWSESNNSFNVYWDDGTGYTIIVYSDEYPNGNIVYTEYDSNGEIFYGTFTFEDTGCNSGIYVRSDGKKFKVRKA